MDVDDLLKVQWLWPPCAVPAALLLFSQAAFAADSDIADGQTQRFDFSILQSMAHDLAQTAWRGAPRPLPDTLATMTPQAYNSIQYDAEKSLWHNVRTVNWTLSSSIWEWDSVAAFVCFL